MVFYGACLLSFPTLMSMKHLMGEGCELCGVVSCVSTYSHDSRVVEAIVWRRHILSCICAKGDGFLLWGNLR